MQLPSRVVNPGLRPIYSDPQQRRRVAKQSFDEKTQIEWLMRESIGRQLVWRLLEAARVGGLLANGTAMVEHGQVAVHDFAIRMLVKPIKEHCPRLLYEMEMEQRDSDGNATNTN